MKKKISICSTSSPELVQGVADVIKNLSASQHKVLIFIFGLVTLWLNGGLCSFRHCVLIMTKAERSLREPKWVSLHTSLSLSPERIGSRRPSGFLCPKRNPMITSFCSGTQKGCICSFHRRKRARDKGVRGGCWGGRSPCVLCWVCF